MTSDVIIKKKKFMNTRPPINRFDRVHIPTSMNQSTIFFLNSQSLIMSGFFFLKKIGFKNDITGRNCDQIFKV